LERFEPCGTTGDSRVPFKSPQQVSANRIDPKALEQLPVISSDSHYSSILSKGFTRKPATPSHRSSGGVRPVICCTGRGHASRNLFAIVRIGSASLFSRR